MKKGNGYWTKERCAEEANKYKSRTEFQHNSPAYKAAYRKGWIDEICNYTKPKKCNFIWNFEKCKEEALKYMNRKDFQKFSGSAYNSSVKNNWIGEITKHFTPKVKDIWTFEKCKEEALKFKTLIEFRNESKVSFGVSSRNKWLEEICSHMLIRNCPGFWTKDECIKKALEYTTLSEFATGCSSAYNVSRVNKWLEEICSHMIEVKKPKGFWTKEKCHEEALKYKTKVEFSKNCSSAYSISYTNKWLEEICSHMIIIGNISKRCIYAIEFPDNHVYVGLSYNAEKRFKEHLEDNEINNSGVLEHYKKTKLTPKFKKISEYIDVNEASKLEGIKKTEYQNDGWITLNKAKCGGIGGSKLKWTKEKCQEEALKYETRGEFWENAGSCCNSALKNGWFEEICSHMIEVKKPKGFWTKEKCHEEALKYITKGEFLKNSCAAYVATVKHKWLDDVCKHMKKYTKKQI